MIDISINMISRSTVEIHGQSQDTHRGIWFYDPTLYPTIKAGEEVRFMCCGEEVARGMVVELLDPKEYPKFCSGINSKGFRWV